jgi:hypothetical protein
MSICVITSYYCKVVVGLETQFVTSTLLKVWGGWELGCWRLTRKRLCTPRIGGSKYRWPWIMTKLWRLNFVTHCPAPLKTWPESLPTVDHTDFVKWLLKLIYSYRTDYNNRPSNDISFMTDIDSTSGSLHSEFVRHLFLQDHRETDRFFADSGVSATYQWILSLQHSHQGYNTTDCLEYRRSTYNF